MSDMVENGSSGGGPSLPPGDPHDEFFELCALATTDWLSAEEKKRLDEHLAQCPLCRDALRQYQTLVDTGVPAAALAATDQNAEPDRSLAEASLFARIDREEAVGGEFRRREVPVVPRPGVTALPRADAHDALWQHLWWQSAAGLILAVALGFSIYRTGMHRGREMAQTTAPPAARPAPINPSPPSPTAGDAERAALQRKDDQVAALHAQLAKQSVQVTQLETVKTDLEQELNGADADHASLAQSRDDLARQLDAARSQLQEARERQEASGAQNAADELRVAALSKRLEELRAGIEQKDQELAREQQVLDHDQDIRELMGSRSLYIAEVYDVAKTGDTQKPFGRVFTQKANR
jgi:hypothetical protein